MNSCTGFMSAALLQKIIYCLTGKVVSISPLFCYLCAQVKCNLIGVDQGATIAGAVQAMDEWGSLLEEDMPYHTAYPYRANWRPSQEHLVKAGQFNVGSISRIRDASQGRDYILGNVGGLAIGTPWPLPSGREAHATPVLDFDRKTEKFFDPNSHGPGGELEFDMRYLDGLIRQGRTVVYGVTDMETPQPREAWSPDKGSLLG